MPEQPLVTRLATVLLDQIDQLKAEVRSWQETEEILSGDVRKYRERAERAERKAEELEELRRVATATIDQLKADLAAARNGQAVPTTTGGASGGSSTSRGGEQQ